MTALGIVRLVLDGFWLVAMPIPEDISVMQMQVDYPDSLPDVLQTTRDQFEAEARMAMAVKLFENKRLSSGMAAALAGMSRAVFLLSLHRYGVAMIDLDERELQSDLANA